MNTLDDYFSELMNREGKPTAKLAARWPRKEIASITRCVKSAFK